MNENIWVFRLDKKETVSDRINEVNVVRRRKQQYGLNTSLIQAILTADSMKHVKQKTNTE